MNGAEALCRDEGEPLRRALTVAFDDPDLAWRATVAAFAAADRRWRVVSTYADPMIWVETAAVRHARRSLAAAERRWSATGDATINGLAPRARLAVVLRALRGRSVDDIAVALNRSPAEVRATLRGAYAGLGVVDVDLDEGADPYAT